MWNLVERDEREASVDKGADRFSYLILSYGLLAIVAIRSFTERAGSFDLLALIIIAGVGGAVYRARAGAMGRSATVMLGITILTAIVIGVLVAVATRP